MRPGQGVSRWAHGPSRQLAAGLTPASSTFCVACPSLSLSVRFPERFAQGAVEGDDRAPFVWPPLFPWHCLPSGPRQGSAHNWPPARDHTFRHICEISELSHT